MKQTILLIAILLLCSFISYSQGVISGTITDMSSGEVVEGVIVRLRSGGKVVGYNISDNKGRFEIKLKGTISTPELIFSHMSYKSKSMNLGTKREGILVELSEQATQIKEVAVEAPMIRLKGDTITYNLGAFQRPEDVSLEDALKNLPGVEVEDNGEIKYQGKAISDFYVEGVDILGGRYGVATTNITADMVATVEVMENHQPIKMLRNREFSDQVAMNIKLKKEAKFKPSGKISGRLGYIYNEPLYRLGVNGMLFSKNFQTISSLKYGNTGESNSRTLQSFYSQMSQKGNNLAMNVLGGLQGSSPPLEKERYRTIKDGAGSINTVNKINDDTQLRINANYSYNNELWEYSTLSDYYIGEQKDQVYEQSNPHAIVHKPSLDVNYRKNSDKIFINNSTSGTASIFDQQLPVLNSSNIIEQSRKALGWDISNSFYCNKALKNDNMIMFSSSISYLATPDNEVSYSSLNNANYNYIQNADGRTFHTTNTIRYNFQIGNYIKLFLPLTLNFTNDNVNTIISGRNTSPNHLKGYTFKGNIAPTLEYESPGKRMNLRFTLPTGYQLLDYNQAPKKYNKLILDPSLTMWYTLSTSSKITFNLGAGNYIGDATNFLVNPIQTSYRSAKITSGILAENQNLNTSLSYNFQKPLSFIFFNAMISYDNTKRNLISSQTIQGENILSSNVLSDTHSQVATASASITKHFKKIKSEISLRGYYNWSLGDIIQQNQLTKYTGNGYGFHLRFDMNPVDWFGFDYSGVVGWSNNRYLGTSSTVNQQTHRLRLNFRPIEKLRLFVRGDYVNNQISANQRVDMILLDIGASYKFKKVELELSLNNLLDSREYSYTVFSGLDTFSYRYGLRGREIVFGFRLL